MPSRSFNASEDGSADESRKTPTDVESEAVQNFMFEASAKRVVELNRVDPPGPTAAPVPSPKKFASKRTAKSAFAKPGMRTPSVTVGIDRKLSPQPSPVGVLTEGAELQVLVPRVDRTQSKTTAKAHRAGMPSWLISLLFHAVFLLPLGFFTLATLEKEDLELWASAAPVEEVDEFREIEIDASEDWELLDSPLDSELDDPREAAFSDLSAESALADMSGDASLALDGLGDLGTLFGESGKGLADLGLGSEAGATASFFGTKVEGRRIVYVLDNSGGMRHGQLETLIAELLKSVDLLTSKQQFYIFFYSDTVYPLFYPQPAQNFVRANDRNKRLLRRWLATVEFCVGNAVDEAVSAAETIRPDAVYLLTDGRLKTTQSGRKLNFLLQSADRSFPIHTLGMGTRGSRSATEELQQVAEVNRGTFREIDVPSSMKELAKEKNRPYHKDSPGPVWGRSVKPRF